VEPTRRLYDGLSQLDRRGAQVRRAAASFLVHGLDLGREVLVHRLALDLQGRGQLAGLDRERALEDRELLDLLDAGQPLVDDVELALDRGAQLGAAIAGPGASPRRRDRRRRR
jgi:hypothetical protein